jgi:phosphate transport system protein
MMLGLAVSGETGARGDTAPRTERPEVSMRVSFQRELERLETALQEEGRLVLRAVRRAATALHEHDVALADEVIACDDEIDARYLALEQDVPSLIARQTPVAVDLRLVLAILHANLHLERIGDYCVTIAKLVKLAPDVAGSPTLVEGLDEMGARAQEMVRVAVESFAARDLRRAESLVELDELIDRANRRVVRHVLALGADPALQEWGLRMILASRSLERIGDHAVDIGESTAYLVTGEFREFTDVSHPAAPDLA